MNGLFLGKSGNGKGVFAGRGFRKGEAIMEFRGKLFTLRQLPFPYESVEDRYVQIGKYLYMGPSGGIDDFFNHSCSPNAGLVVSGRKAVLIAIKNISKGSEVTWDYSTTMDEDDWELDCRCGSRACRGRVRDFKRLPKRTRESYIRLGIVPKYILKKEKHL